MTTPFHGEMPLFKPSWEDFQDPYSYIEMILPVAQDKGMCRILPPVQWSPTCCIDDDMDSFMFTAHSQQFAPLKVQANEELKKTEPDAVRFSLKVFGSLADELKMNYFGMPVNKVSEALLESSFWQLFSGESDSDLHVYTAKLPFLSCFPTNDSKQFLPEDKPYIDSPWNLNKLADQSVFKNLVSVETLQLKKPSCSISMCFSSDTWRTTDSWGYSVNYMHWGEPRTWYAVSGTDADKFTSEDFSLRENRFVDREFKYDMIPTSRPDEIRSCRVSKAVQYPGEFVVVFPRSYTMWFSHGFNMVETVNFYPVQWLPFGLECHKWYQTVKQHSKFSFEELICSLLSENTQVELVIVQHKLLKQLIEDDTIHTSKALDTGKIACEKEFFPELMPISDRYCAECNTVCFLSAVKCPCVPRHLETCCLSVILQVFYDVVLSDKMVCCRHFNQLCKCSSTKRCLYRRYSSKYMKDVLDELQLKVENFSDWSTDVENALSGDSEGKPDLSQLKTLQKDSRKYWMTSKLYKRLSNVVELAMRYSREAKKVLASNRKGRESQNTDMLTFEEMQLFSTQIDNLQCRIPEGDQIREMMQTTAIFRDEVRYYLKNSELPTSSKIQQLIERSDTVEVFIPEMPLLKQWKLGRHWLDDVTSALSCAENLTVESMRQMIERGVALPPHPSCESLLIHIQQLLSVGMAVDDKARQCLLSRPSQSLVHVQSILDEANRISAHLPNVAALRSAVEMATRWITSVDRLLSQQHSPFVSVLENYVAIAHTLPIHLDRLSQLDSCINAAKSWYERTAKTFLKKNSNFTLLEVLVPRTDIGMAHGYKVRRRKGKDLNSSNHNETSNVVRLLSDVSVDSMPDPTTLVVAFREDQFSEVDAMVSLRTLNNEKLAGHIDVAADKYCICRHSRAASMLQCEVCKDLFHPECVSATKPAMKSGYNSDVKFLCPMCSRSRRPRLETALSLLLALQKLPVRVDCGEALQLLAERAMAWQDLVKKFLATEEMKAVLQRLGDKFSDHTSAFERADKIVTTEMQKAGLFHRRAASSTVSPYDERASAYEQDSTVGAMMPIEHAYSSVSKHGAVITQSPVTHRKVISSSSPVAAMQSIPSSIWLSNNCRAQLEHLMMEGDMIEVALDETQLLWKILKACHPNTSDSSTLRTKGPTDILSTAAKFDSTEEQHRKRRKHLEVRSEDSQIELFLTQKKQKEKSTKGSNRLDDDTKKNKASKLNKKSKSKQKQRLPTSDGDDVLTAADNNEEDCSAVMCLKPLGSEVDWVQCDACQLWFHLVCVGLSKVDVSDDIDYMCQTCRVPPSVDARHFTTSIPVTLTGEHYGVGSFHSPISNVLGTGQSSHLQNVNAGETNNDTVFCETVMESSGVGYKYVTAEGDVYETQVIEYENNDISETADVVLDSVDMECHEVLDNVQSSSDHVVIALSDNQMIYPANQVVYMYADGTGPEIEGVEDMIEIETVGSAVDMHLDQSCDVAEMDHVEEDIEMRHELVIVDSSRAGIPAEADCELADEVHADADVAVQHSQVVCRPFSAVDGKLRQDDDGGRAVVIEESSFQDQHVVTNEITSGIQLAPYIHLDVGSTTADDSSVLEYVGVAALCNIPTVKNTSPLDDRFEQV